MPLRPIWILLAVGRRRLQSLLIALSICAVFMVPVVAIVIYYAWREKKRTAALKEVAEKLGFDFVLKDEPATFLDGLPLHSRGYGKKLSGLMRGRSDSFDLALFDYRYVTGGGRSSQTRQQSVVWFQSTGLDLTDFSLASRSFWHTVRGWFGQPEIFFDTHPLFAKKYVVLGSNEAAIRELFNGQLLEFFEQRTGWSMEGLDDRLLLYQPAKRWPAAKFPELLETGLQVLALIHAAQ